MSLILSLIFWTNQSYLEPNRGSMHKPIGGRDLTVDSKPTLKKRRVQLFLSFEHVLRIGFSFAFSAWILSLPSAFISASIFLRILAVLHPPDEASPLSSVSKQECPRSSLSKAP